MYYRDEPNSPPAASYNAVPIANSASFKYKTSITGKTSNANQENGENTEKGNTKTEKNLEIVVPLKHLSSFRRSLDMPLINCEVSMTLTWSGNCVLTDITKQAARTAQGGINPTFTKVNRLFVLSFENENDGTSFSKYYVPNVQRKDFNVLISGKSVFDLPIKNDEEKNTNKLSKWKETMIKQLAVY